jgi:hexosaminidase
MKISFLLLLLLSTQLLNSFKSEAQSKNQPNIIPKPTRMICLEGNLLLQKNMRFDFSDEVENKEVLALYLSDQIYELTGLRIPTQPSATVNDSPLISFKQVRDSTWGNEDYAMNIDEKGILIEARSGNGFFYGIQSLLQIIPLQTAPEVPFVSILDQPEYSYRGMHLDVCRHFFSVDFIKSYLDLMAMYKMNTFHWHLTEDQGWRIEIKKYPKLTEIGAWRTEKDGSRYGGFYSQEQIREIVAYAADRFISVIPEIELPGHSLAALSAYPNLACTEGPFEATNDWGVFKDVYCAGKESTFEFLQNVMLEVIDLFPSKYIHIGGDECPKERWEQCELCQKRMQEEGLKDEHELQSYFIQRIEKFLASKGRKIIGWDEILEGGLAPDATVMSWRGTKGGIEAAHQHHQVIMTPVSHCYFDFYQDVNYIEPTAIGGFTPLKKVYEFEPTPPSLTDDEAKYILGAQGNVWTEYMPNPDQVEYMLAPRICALSEVLWSKKQQRNWIDFQNRMNHHYALLKAKNWNVFLPAPKGGVNRNFFFNKMSLPLECDAMHTKIRYTLDGSEPDVDSKIYTHPIEVNTTITLKVQTVHESGVTSRVRNIECIQIDPLQTDTLSKFSEGVKYQIFTGKFSSLDEIRKDKVSNCGVTDLLTYPEDVEDEFYAVELTTFLRIDENATYTFFNYSVDPVRFTIGNHVLIEQEGLNSRFQRRARIYLQKGIYPIQMLLIKNTPYANQKISWASSLFDQTPIPTKLLCY